MDAEELGIIYETRKEIINSGSGVFQISLRPYEDLNLLMPKTIFPCKIKLTSDGDYEFDPKKIKDELIEGKSIYVEWDETDENQISGTLDRWRVASIEGPFIRPTIDELLSVPEAAVIWGKGIRTIRSCFKQSIETNDGMVSKFDMMKYFGALQSLPIHLRSFYRIMVKDYRRDGFIYKDMRIKDWIEDQRRLQLYIYEKSLK
ncbi:hypothetical protein MKZ15_15425 [Paenibacillus sp. FSL R7-0216]|uniref:hypothetical protein n=1 Tax=Paenibacillus sp. FSL R7-0216 TaxID=2921677 RepID=UPI0030DAB753